MDTSTITVCSASDTSDNEDGDQKTVPLNAVSLAFGIDLIREKILNYAIRRNTEGGTFDVDTLRSCRLVQSTWLHYISGLLRSSRQPLFYFSLDDDTEENGQLLNQLSELEEVPPSKLTLQSDFFIHRNLPQLVEMLTLTSKSLVELTILFPANGGSMLFFIPSLSFPILQRITVTFVNYPELGDNDEIDDEDFVRKTSGLVYLLYPFLQGSQELKEFSMPFVAAPDLSPAGFGNMPLPSTLTKMDLSYKFASEDLEILVNNQLPCLKSLEILQAHIKLEDGLVFRILKNLRHSLERFTVQSTIQDGRFSAPPTLYRLPVMEKLSCLNISAFNWNLDTTFPAPCMEACVPKLKHLTFDDVSATEFYKWTLGQKYGSVERLSVRLVDPSVARTDNPRCILNLDDETMANLNMAFGNLKRLDVSLAGMDLSGLRYLFREMAQLRNLKIEVAHAEDGILSWDPLLIQGSITNLKALQKLTLESIGSPQELWNVSLISDELFTSALLEMKELSQLKLQGRFQVSRQMARRWRRLGKCLWFTLEEKTM